MERTEEEDATSTVPEGQYKGIQGYWTFDLLEPRQTHPTGMSHLFFFYVMA